MRISLVGGPHRPLPARTVGGWTWKHEGVRNPLRDLPREVAVLVSVAFFVAVGFGIVAPALPVFAREFGVGKTASGAVISAFAVARLGSALGAGRLVDRFGERRVLATGIVIVAVSSLLAGLAANYPQLVVLRGAGGVGSAMFSVSATSLLLRVVGPTQRGRAVGMWQGGFLIGAICGPALGGVVTGVSIRAPFFLYAGTLAVAGTIALVALRHTALGARAEAADRGRTALGTALRHPAYRAALATNLAEAWSVLAVRSAIVPLFVTEALGLGAEWIGVGFVIVAGVNAALLLPAGNLADTRGRRPLLVAGLGSCAAGLALLALAPNLPGYLGAMALIGVGSGLLDVAPGAILGDVVGGRGGTAVAAYQMAADVGNVAGPVVAGLLVDSYGYPVAFTASAAVVAAALLLSVAAPETRIRPPAAAPSEPASDPAAPTESRTTP